ncbi:MAG: glucose-1-phosphate adenylyltransferase [Clostridia bacterium]|nr:glucose-1-phosphate adenylyltransferase [Clostridia bacterium]
MLKRSKECIAMLLAGGQGSRLKVLTESTAKPALPFGGKYRIIDFPLSNCTNSGIDTVGILTQYQPLELNDYIGNGVPWGLNRNFGGSRILPPYAQNKKTEWYKGTANAIYQNIGYIDSYNPEYVLILSGDHIYKMNYAKMLAYHKKKGADCTIAVLDVPIEEAPRFGIMNTAEDDSIYEFEEKPKHPKSTMASMGIYLFNWNILRSYLIEDEENPKSHNDFGHDIIPKMIEDSKKLFAYKFEGYWKDVGTIDSLWQANMDLLDSNHSLNISDTSFKIYARNYALPPSAFYPSSSISNSMISEGCSIKGTVKNSIISTGCTVEEGAVVEDSVIMPGSIIHKNASVFYAITGSNSEICEGAVVGGRPEESKDGEWGIAVVGRNTKVETNKRVLPNEII